MDTWEELHLPVLRAAVERYDETGHAMRVNELVEASGLGDDQVQRALRALRHEEPPFFTKMDGSMGGGILVVGAPTGHARRAVGQWPTPEALADRIVAALRTAADREQDEEASGRLRRLASWFGAGGRDVLVEVAATAVTRGVGM